MHWGGTDEEQGLSRPRRNGDSPMCGVRGTEGHPAMRQWPRTCDRRMRACPSGLRSMQRSAVGGPAKKADHLTTAWLGADGSRPSSFSSRFCTPGLHTVWRTRPGPCRILFLAIRWKHRDNTDTNVPCAFSTRITREMYRRTFNKAADGTRLQR